jgi:gamma-glutamyltranspeptidase/glutathione hydrolase
VHFEDGVVYAEPGVPVEQLEADGRVIVPFNSANVFFGGVQAVERDLASGEMTGAGDPRRSGVAVSA